jgi:hypothetical protein
MTLNSASNDETGPSRAWRDIVQGKSKHTWGMPRVLAHEVYVAFHAELSHAEIVRADHRLLHPCLPGGIYRFDAYELLNWMR